MRSKNSAPIDALESAFMADVKRCRCVFCNSAPPVEAHHVKQGRHFCTVAACKPCHDAKAWRIGHPNEFDAMNETRRRVEELRAGVTTLGTARRSAPKPVKSSTYQRSAKIHPRRNECSQPVL